MLLIQPTYRLHGFGLGDMWSSWNYIIRKSIRTNKVSVFHAIKQGWNDSEIRYISNYERDLFQRISSLLVHGGNNISITPRDKNLFPLGTVYHEPYLPTKLQWQDNNNKIITYAFDGQHLMHRKRCDPKDSDNLLGYLREKGYHLIDVGNHKPLEWIVEMLSQAEWHLGLDSGITHIAQSVGTPANIMFNRLNLFEIVKLIYPNKPINLFHTARNLWLALKNGFDPKNKLFHLDVRSVQDYIKNKVYMDYCGDLRQYLSSFMHLVPNRNEIYKALNLP